MSFFSELLKAVRDLGALEKRTEDVLRAVEKLSAKVDLAAERLSRLEVEYAHLQSSVKNEIMADIKSELVHTKLLFDLDKTQRNNSVALTHKGEA
jgi:uncharacterized protein (UPF0335 family)